MLERGEKLGGVASVDGIQRRELPRTNAGA